ncbi:MAG: GxxExxY protein [Verrucomicrobiaceae bacterium]|nr:GxxExxY protein [Verrucomicrobiaceae bacterium]
MTQDNPVSRLVIGKAMEVHRQLGPGLVEAFYHQLLAEKLAASGLQHEVKPRRQLIYRGHVADEFEPDLVVTGHFIPELKALRGTFASAHFTQLLAYLKFWNLGFGLLMDFAKESLALKRVLPPADGSPEFQKAALPAFVHDHELAHQMLEFIEHIQRDHGLGYRETTYRGLFVACLKHAQMVHVADPMAQVAHLGMSTLRCIVVENRCVVSISALGEGLTAADRAVLQTSLKWLRLPWGIAVHFGKKRCDARFVVAPSSTQK